MREGRSGGRVDEEKDKSKSVKETNGEEKREEIMLKYAQVVCHGCVWSHASVMMIMLQHRETRARSNSGYFQPFYPASTQR